MSFWLISVPNESKDGSSVAASNKLRKSTEALFLSKNYDFNIPQLKVGTLDTLMALSDDLNKYDTQLAQLAEKIKRTYYDMQKTEQQEAEAKDAKDLAANKAKNPNNPPKQNPAAPPKSEELKVGGKSAREFLTKFEWNETRFPKRSPLRSITDLITVEAVKADDSLKKQISDYNEVRSAYSAIERKDTGTLLVKPLAPLIQPKDIIEKGHLTTVLLVVPRTRVVEFEQTYEFLEDQYREKEKEDAVKREKERQEKEAKDAEFAKELAKSHPQHQHHKAPAADKHAQSSNPNKSNNNDKDDADHEHSDQKHEEKHDDDSKSASNDKSAENKPVEQQQHAVKPLPCKIVVPGSARKLVDDGTDEFVIYRVVVIREGADLFKNLCREKRFTIRPFALNQTEEKEEKQKKAEFAKMKRQLWSHLLRWCEIGYTQTFSAWIHIKAIRIYVESVLRYGLPANFSAFLLEPGKGKDKQLRTQLKDLYSKLAGSNANLTTLDSNEIDLSGFGADFYPYVYLPVALTD